MKRLAFSTVAFLFLSISLTAQNAPAPPVFKKSSKIKVTQTSISLEKYGPMKEDVTFKAGETVFINLELTGLMANEENQVAVQADLAVPQLNLDRKNLIDGSTDFEEKVPMFFQIPIDSIERGGTCFVTIIIRDMVASTQVEFMTTFELMK